MALARKTLVAQNDVIGPINLNDPFDRNGAATIQYFSGGGTVVLEATNDDALKSDNSNPNPSAVWVTITSLVDATGATVASISAAGSVRAEIVGFKWVRARLSVAAGANTDCALNVKIN